MAKQRFTARIAVHTALMSLMISPVAALSGCFLAKSAGAQGAAPVVDTDAASREYAYWRGKYVGNRMVPPEHYSVPPAAPRDNAFGEFDDAMYSGLDSQPVLPPLPGDGAISAMAAPSFYGGQNAAYAAAGGGADSVVADTSGNAPFFPIEQLVYGGDHAPPDSPGAYRLMPGDEIAVTVREHPEFSGKLTLRPDGTVRVPNTPDPIRLRGMTADEAADAVRGSVAVYVKGDCVVRVQANRARGGYYFVLGDVRQPGRFPMGMEPVRLSDAVMAANFETAPNRLPADEELSPAFPAASPRGASVAPRTADLARVMLITPHRSNPVRTTHDLRQAMLGMTAGDPVVRPGQIIVVPSLDPEKNAGLGIDMSGTPGRAVAPPAALLPGQGFSTGNSPERLPEVLPYADVNISADDVFGGAPATVRAASRNPRPRSRAEAEENLRRAYAVQSAEEPARMAAHPHADEYFDGHVVEEHEEYAEEYPGVLRDGDVVHGETVTVVESVDPVLPASAAVADERGGAEPIDGAVVEVRGRRLRKAPFADALGATVGNGGSGSASARKSVDGWNKGF